MAALSVSNPFEYFTESDGSALEAGYIYLGTSGQNPETNPIAVYWDDALTQPAAQPIRTIGGYPSRNGSAAKLFVDSSSCSITVKNRNGGLIYSALVNSSLFVRTADLSSTASGKGAALVGADDGASGSLWVTVQGFITYLLSSLGSSAIGFIQSGVGAVMRSVQAKLRDAVCVFDFMTATQIADVRAGTITEDVTDAINAAITSVSAYGGRVWLPTGRYKVTSTIVLPHGVSLVGDGQIRGQDATREGVTSIWAVHTDVAILSLKGAIGCTVADLSLEAGSGAVPKTGLLLGRSSAASAGYHKIMRVAVYGHYSVAPIYSIASEDNLWEDINVWLFGGGAKYCFYTGISDGLAIGASLTTSSNLDNTFYRPFFVNSSADADAACIFIQGAQAVGSWSFFGGYLTAYAGSYIQIDNGSVDALSMLGPITFIGMNGEILSGGDPIYGVRLTATGTMTLPGLTVLGMRFAFEAGTNHYQILQPANLFLESPNIHIQPPEAFPYALSSMQRTLIKSGNVTVGRVAEWTAPTFAGTWANVYGAPYTTAGYSMDGFGVVRFRGTVGPGTGAIFTLPADYRPAANLLFPVYATGGMGRVLITAATGVVSLSAGTGTEVDLSSIAFKIN